MPKLKNVGKFLKHYVEWKFQSHGHISHKPISGDRIRRVVTIAEELMTGREY